MTVTRLDWEIYHGGVILPVVGGSLTIDDQNIPAIVAQVVVPHDDALFDAIDPRQTAPPRLSLRGTQKHWASRPVSAVSAFAVAEGGTIADLTDAWTGLQLYDLTNQFGAPLHPLASSEAPGRLSMSLHAREISSDGYTMTIDLASDEALLTDWAPTSAEDMIRMNGNATGDPQQVRYWVDAVTATVLGRTPVPNAYSSSALSATYTEIIDWSSWASAWDMMRPAIDDTGLKLRVHPDGTTFTLERPVNTINPPATHSWYFDPANTISVRPVRTRLGDWYDSALVQPQGGHTSGSGVSAGYPTGGGDHSRTLIESVPDTVRPTQGMATNLVTRARNRGQLLDIEAPAMLKPSGGVFMRDEVFYSPTVSGPGEPWQCKSVGYDFLTATMRLRCEKPY